MWIASWALNTLIAKGKSTDWMVHMLGQAVAAYTDDTHGMTLSSVSMPYYRFILPYGLKKFKRYAQQVWDVRTENKSDEEIAGEGLDRMEAYLKGIGCVMSIKDFGVTADMIEDICDSVFILKGGYHVLTREDVICILKESVC